MVVAPQLLTGYNTLFEMRSNYTKRLNQDRPSNSSQGKQRGSCYGSQSDNSYIQPLPSLIFLQGIKMGLSAVRSSWERYLESNHPLLGHQDRFSTLPDTVLTHLMSFLPPSDKDHLKVLSRTWRRVSAQDQKKLWLTGIRLNELEFPKIFNDDFHSVEFLALKECPGMSNLRFDSFKLSIIYLSHCGTLKKVQLNTPNLNTLYFYAPRDRPCTIEFINCKNLSLLHLDGFDMKTNMFENCDESLPFLQFLRLVGCDKMSASFKISSNSLQDLSLTRFNELVDLNIDAPNLVSFKHSGTTVPNFQNINFPSLFIARIKLHPKGYQKEGDDWFVRLIKMLQCLKHAERLSLCATSKKNLIIPTQLRGTLLTPPLEKMSRIFVKTNSRSGSIVDVVDSMLWVCPRVTRFLCSSNSWESSLWISYEELSLGLPANLCRFCTSASSRCWRHSVRGFMIHHSRVEAKEEVAAYILENIRTAGRNDVGRRH